MKRRAEKNPQYDPKARAAGRKKNEEERKNDS